MIEDLRWVEKTLNKDPNSGRADSLPILYIPHIQTVLQAYDGYVWFDVPFAGRLSYEDSGNPTE